MREYSYFRASAGALRDNVVSALSSEQLAVVERGLSAYGDVLAAIVNESRVQGVEAVSDWDEWRQLIRDLIVIGEFAARGTSRTWYDVVAWLRVQVGDRLRSGDFQAARDLIGILTLMWTDQLHMDSPDSRERLRALLLHVSELRAYQSYDAPTPGSSRAADLVVARAFADQFRAAWSAHDARAARLVTAYIDHAFNRMDDGLGAGPLALILYGWVLFDVTRRAPRDSEDVRGALAALLPDRVPLVDCLEGALASDLEAALGWHWWESQGDGPVSGGIVELPHFVDLAVAVLSAEHELLGWHGPQAERWTAHRLVEAIDGLLEDNNEVLRSMVRNPERLRRGREDLQAVLDADEIRRSQALASRNIEEDRLEQFRASLLAALDEARPESLLVSLGVVDAEADAAVANFGYDRLVPRDYFAETEVVAEPDRLGRDLGRAIIRGEDERMLEVLTAGLQDGQAVPLETARSELDLLLASEGTEDSFVLITNSHNVVRALLPGGDPWGHPTTRLRYRGCDLLRVYDDRSPYVVLTPRGTNWARLRRVTVADPSVPLADGFLTAEVSVPSPDDFDRWEAGDAGSELEGARLRSRVRVRVLEHLDVGESAPAGTRAWRLPDSTW